MTPHFRGAYTVKYAVPDLDAAKAFYAKASGVAPYFDEPFYVGFNIGGDELGLDPDLSVAPNGPGGTVAYWGVSDIAQTAAHLLACGAKEIEAPKEVGEGIKVATYADPWGNLIGIIENPHHT
ncbi:MAG TPA: VOC family protein [Gemmatimonadales bacterium]|nr:VOC family protein [Gemmatimonadales bacterium]